MNDDSGAGDGKAWSRRSIGRAAVGSLPLLLIAGCSGGGVDVSDVAAVAINGVGDPAVDKRALDDGLAKAHSLGVAAVVKGTFELEDTVLLPPRTVLMGFGASFVQRRPRKTTVSTNGASGARIHGLTIRGFSKDYVNSPGVYAATGILVSEGSRDVRIVDCAISGCAGAGVRISKSSDVDISGCRIEGPGKRWIKDSTYNYSGGVVAHSDNGSWSAEFNDISGYAQGIVTDPLQNNFRIIGNRVHDIPGQHGLYLESVNRAVIEGNVVWNTGSLGMKIQIPTENSADAVDVVVSGNVFESVGNTGILLTNHSDQSARRVRRVVVSSNIVDGAGTDGITLIGASSTGVHSNIIYNTGRHGISLRGCEGVDICHNRIESSMANGISISTSTDWIIDSNRIDSPAQMKTGANFGIYIAASSSDGRVSNNKVTDVTGRMRSPFRVAGNKAAAKPSTGISFAGNYGANSAPLKPGN